MPKRIKRRALTKEERKELTKLSKSRSVAYQIVERARIILAADTGQKPVDIAADIGVTPPTVYKRLNRFQSEGLAALADRQRPGRKPLYTEEERGTMVAIARTHPDTLKLPFGFWSLDRLVAYLGEHHQIGVSRAQLGRILKEEGLRWYQEKVYFTASPDPQFGEKRGPSSPSSSSPQPIPTSSVSMNSDR